jgi:glycosyltransferase involved in cell wall biosynthesis
MNRFSSLGDVGHAEKPQPDPGATDRKLWQESPWKPMPSVSVAFVAYNQEAFIQDALESALAQDWAPLEIIVADDGSSDGTREVVEQVARRVGERVRLEAGPNLGITGNCNRALRACRGDYVAFIGGDDLLLPGKIAAQVAWLQASPARVLCAHDVEHFESESGRRICLQSDITPMRRGVGALDMIERGNPFASPAILLRRSAIPPRGFDERLPRVSDGKLWMDCAGEYGEWGYVPGVLARYRKHAGSISVASAQACYQEALRAMDLLAEDHPSWRAACARGRARLHYRNAVEALQLGRDLSGARSDLWASLRLAPLRSSKLPAWIAISYLPAALRQLVLERVSA